MGLKSTCRLCGSVHEAIEMATPVFIGDNPVMRSEFGYFLPDGFVCHSCVAANDIDIEQTVRGHHERQRKEQQSDAEHVQSQYKKVFDHEGFDWGDWESTANGARDRSRLTVGSEVMLRHSSAVLKVEGIILPPVVNYGKSKMVQSWSKVGITEHVVLMLEGGRFVRGNTASSF